MSAQNPLSTMLGIPAPFQFKEHIPTYFESLMYDFFFFLNLIHSRFIATFLVAALTPFLKVPFSLCNCMWCACYIGSVVMVHVLGVGRKFSAYSEFCEAFSHFIAFVVLYLLVYNGLITFGYIEQ